MLDDRRKKLQLALSANVETKKSFDFKNSTEAQNVLINNHSERYKRVLKMLEDDAKIKRAVVNDVESDSDNVIMTIAIRDTAVFEVFILKSRFDGLSALQILDNLNYQTTH